MPRTTKTKPAPVPQSEPESTVVKGLPGEVLTLAEAAAYLRFSEADVLRLVNEQALPARRLGNEWRFLKAAIQRWLSVPLSMASKEAWMSLAGAWKDDPDVAQELKEIYQRRGRSMTEDGG